MKTSSSSQFEQAIARLPLWILGLAAAGTALALFYGGFAIGCGFLLGALAAYVNFRLIERAVYRVTGSKRPGGTVARILIQFTLLLLGAFVILKSSGFSLAAAFLGFLVCPAAAILEMVYELVIYEHS